MDDELSSSAMQRLLGVNKVALNGLAKTYDLQASVTGYCRHLREEAAGRGGEAGQTARERLGQAQATLAETKAKQLTGELVDASAVEQFWKAKLRAFRNRVLSIPSRVRDLSARQNVILTQELRGALTELADDNAT